VSKYGLKQVAETEQENQVEAKAWWEKKRLVVILNLKFKS
jgi:hypothetical protein